MHNDAYYSTVESTLDQWSAFDRLLLTILLLFVVCNYTRTDKCSVTLKDNITDIDKFDMAETDEKAWL